MASGSVRLHFIAMERSLRATGYRAPLFVIPYNDDLFDLPTGSSWWKIEEIEHWLQSHNARSVMRKYQCLTASNYQFVDSDVIFLKNPEEVFQPFSGFITSCTHWHNPGQTYTGESLKFIKKTTTIWQSKIFNTGQFACDRSLYNIDELKETAESNKFISTCLQDPFHEQPGINLLVAASGVTITNLTLPPIDMESTWAGDYRRDYESYWKDERKKPYLIHWAGGVATKNNFPINKLFENFLTHEELVEWIEIKKLRKRNERSLKYKFNRSTMRLKNSLRAFKDTWMEKD